MILSDIIEVLVYFIFVVTVIPTGITICKKLLDNVKNEEHLEKGKILQSITKTYALVQCMAWPMIDALSLMLVVNKRVSTYLSPTMANNGVILVRFMYSVLTSYLACNSLVIASVRYVFVVHDGRAARCGIKKLRKTFLLASFCAPMFVAVLNEAMIPIEYNWIANFMPTANDFLQKDEYGHLILADNSTFNIRSSPLFSLADLYLHSTFNDILRIICKILVFLIFSNIIEGFQYTHIYYHFKR